ncbi:hypothetical protein CsSME_00005945 [Camellia sinensis var. sinensis]
MKCHVSVVKQILRPFTSFFNLALSLVYMSTMSLATVCRDGILNLGCMTLQNLLKPTPSTNLKGNSSITIISARYLLPTSIENDVATTSTPPSPPTSLAVNPNVCCP